MKSPVLLGMLLALSPTAFSSSHGSLHKEKPIVSLMLYADDDPEKRLEKYREELNLYDISVSVPADFNPIDVRGRNMINYNINPKYDGVSFLPNVTSVALEADNREAVLLLPQVYFESLIEGHTIESDLRQNHDNMALDIRPLISVIAQSDMSDYANADTVVTYEFDFKRPYLNHYSHCIGVYLRKKAHPAILAKIALNNKALNKKDEYIRLLLDNISFGDNPDAHLVELEKSKTKKDLNFPTVHRENTGILPSINDETLAELNRVKAWCAEHGIKELPRISDEVLEALNDSKKFREQKAIEADSILSDNIHDKDKVLSYAMLEKTPEFPGGDQAMHNWLDQNMRYPEKAQKAGQEVTILVEFIVNSDGTLRDVKSKHRYDRDSMFVKEAIRLFKSMPKWQPATYKGKAVNAYYTRPVEFRIKGRERNPHVIEQHPYLAWNGKPYEMSNVPKIPEYPGGATAMYKWIADNIVYPADAVKAKIEGKVLVEFIISEKGSIENPKVIKSVSECLDKEAIRVVSAMPRWEPGYANGSPVKTKFTVPVSFKLAKER